jgi:mRNA-degrading endonuclease RelE of RelBE toxin-antitoxin system
MRKVDITKNCLEDIKALDKRNRQWVLSIVDYLKDEQNTIEVIEQRFPMLSGGLHGYRKAKNRSFGLRILFTIQSDKRVRLTIDNHFNRSSFDEIIKLFAVDHRDKIYDVIRKRIK